LYDVGGSLFSYLQRNAWARSQFVHHVLVLLNDSVVHFQKLGCIGRFEVEEFQGSDREAAFSNFVNDVASLSCV
jgi:hypothetical protein